VYCKQLDAGAFSDDKVVKASEGLIRILVDNGKDGKLFQKYNISGMPTILFLDAEGKQVGSLGDRSAGGVEKQLTEIASKHSRAPQWIAGADAAVTVAKDGSKPGVLVFVDDKPKSQLFLKIFSDPAMAALYEKASFGKVEFKKDSEECRKWKVTEAPVCLIVDPADESKPLKTWKSGTAKALAKEIEEAAKKLKK